MRVTSYAVELNGVLNVLTKESAVNYETILLNNPVYIVRMMNDVFRMNRKAEEHVYILAMNTKCKLIGVFLLTKGTVNATIVSPREIFVRLCLCGACGYVLLHNHPSGDTTPSNEDINVTKRMKECSTLMGIKMMDHIIIGDDYYSFNEKGLL